MKISDFLLSQFLPLGKDKQNALLLGFAPTIKFYAYIGNLWQTYDVFIKVEIFIYRIVEIVR